MQSRSVLGFALAALLGLSDPAAAQTALISHSQNTDQPKGRESADVDADDPAVRLVQEWLHEMQTADDAAYIAFVRQHIIGLPGDPGRWLQFRHRARGLRLYKVKSASADGIELWLFDPNIESYVTTTVKLQPGDKVAMSRLQSTDEIPIGAPVPKRLEGAPLIEAINARAEHYAKEDDFSGAVLLALRGRILFQKAYGLADREAHKPNRLNTQFRFGSMGKLFTTIAIMQLVQDGKIDLSAPIGRYLKNYPNQDLAAKVTVSNLLTHTGGTGDIFGPEFKAHQSALRNLSDYVDLYGPRALEFDPGSRFGYSNYGFVLLGRIIEQASGLTYDQYLQRNIFEPAGMHSTGNLPESDPLPNRAVAYTGFGANLTRADATLPVRGTSAGGGYSTVGDFNRFVDAVVSHRLLRAETLQTLLTGGITGSDGKFYRYDFGGTMEGTGRYIGHDGEAPGMNGDLLHFLDSGYTVIVLANRDPPSAETIMAPTLKRLPAM